MPGPPRVDHPGGRKRKKADYLRRERARSMDLWQMDIVGGVRLVDGSEVKVVTGVDDGVIDHRLENSPHTAGLVTTTGDG